MTTTPPVWLRHRAVLEHLGVDPKTLRGRMANSPPHLDTPWINIGSARRPDYRWRADAVDPWWVAVNRWRSVPAERGNAIRGAPRARARAAPPDGDTGGLAALVRSRLKSAA